MFGFNPFNWAIFPHVFGPGYAVCAFVVVFIVGDDTTHILFFTQLNASFSILSSCVRRHTVNSINRRIFILCFNGRQHSHLWLHQQQRRRQNDFTQKKNVSAHDFLLTLYSIRRLRRRYKWMHAKHSEKWMKRGCNKNGAIGDDGLFEWVNERTDGDSGLFKRHAKSIIKYNLPAFVRWFIFFSSSIFHIRLDGEKILFLLLFSRAWELRLHLLHRKQNKLQTIICFFFFFQIRFGLCK